MLNRGCFNNYIEIFEKEETSEENALGEKNVEYVFKKGIFVNVESRIGGLLTGRQAGTVVSTVTHKLTYDMREYPVLENDKNIIKLDGHVLDVNYTLNEDNNGDILQVFCTEKSIKQHTEFLNG